jgi:tRNA (guanine-N7-)-methyltransferase
MTDSKPLRSFGRIKARALKPNQERLIETLLPRLAIDPAAPPAIDVLEVGFGGGEHLAAQAAAAPGLRFLGVEPFLNGVGSCLRHIDEAAVRNVRLHMGDVRDVLPAIPTGSVQRVYVLFPDPWPKARHHKRRLIQAEFLAEMVRVLAPGGDLLFATDWRDYAAWTLERALKTPGLVWTAVTAGDWRTPWAGHVRTRYEEKKLGDTAPVFLGFKKAV